MGYVAVKGGSKAVLHAEQLVEYFRLKSESEPITPRQLQGQMRLAVDRAMGEGSLYAPALAALALKQSEGDALEASFLLRAYRSTVPRIDYTLPAQSLQMRLLRRLSATFQDIPGGQLLGPTRDYQLRLLNTLLGQETSESACRLLHTIEAELNEEPLDEHVSIFPKVIASMKADGLLAEPPLQEQEEAQEEPYDITRTALTFPAPRSARLQVMARSDLGSLLAFAYSSVRGYGDTHPTIAELRVGYLPVEVSHPLTGEAVSIGEILVTECETVSRVFATTEDEQQGSQGLPRVYTEENLPRFGLGYGFCFGHNEVKAVSMAIIDRVLSAAKERGVHGEEGPAANEEFVLQHIDGIEASGFVAHYKLPHYVSFQADISVLKRAREHQAAAFAAKARQRQSLSDLGLHTTANEES